MKTNPQLQAQNIIKNYIWFPIIIFSYFYDLRGGVRSWTDSTCHLISCFSVHGGRHENKGTRPLVRPQVAHAQLRLRCQCGSGADAAPPIWLLWVRYYYFFFGQRKTCIHDCCWWIFFLFNILGITFVAEDDVLLLCVCKGKHVPMRAESGETIFLFIYAQEVACCRYDNSDLQIYFR